MIGGLDTAAAEWLGPLRLIKNIQADLLKIMSPNAELRAVQPVPVCYIDLCTSTDQQRPHPPGR